MGTLVAFSVVSAAVPVLRAKGIGEQGKGFRVPFGPYLVPGLSILACLYIIKTCHPRLSGCFSIWMVIAVAGYFSYGIRHSRLHHDHAAR